VSKNRKSGLPENMDMKHDDHYVDLISTRSSGPEIRMIGLTKINTNPRSARIDMNGIEGLALSIKEKGVLSPLLVRSMNGRYEIIAGDRRYIASKLAKINDVPCIVMNVQDNEALEIALTENLQRKDLDIFEEADGLKYLKEKYGYNNKKIAKKIGKKLSTVQEIYDVSQIPEEIRELCKKFEIKSKNNLIEIAEEVMKSAKK